MNIWQQCEGHQHIKNLDVIPWRVVEAQHVSNTRKLVDTSEEHDILENLLEITKPIIEKNTNYLIFTPFRYPPLKYGSRFSTQQERSLWYGSLDISTALAEVAYYRLFFLKDTEAELGYISIFLTAFSTQVKTDKGIDLTQPPFSEYHKKISSPQNYDDSQLLGANMRKAKVQAFLFTSARSSNQGINFAAYTPEVFHKKRKSFILQQQTWSCVANKMVVEFFREKEKYVFSQMNFL